METDFEQTIGEILFNHFGAEDHERLLDSPLIGYLRKKTRAANRGSKSRGSFANLYALYVLAEDYVEKGFLESGDYNTYEGAKYSDLFARQRRLPFGQKLQNHALNSRLNDEFHKFYPTVDSRPIIRDMDTQRYWLSEAIFVDSGFNLSNVVIEIVDAYVSARQGNFLLFLNDCKRIRELGDESLNEKVTFVKNLLSPSSDARVFEIVSFAIMATLYGEQTVWFGFTEDSVEPQKLQLYKTGRTNANDGGIDFVMRPLGRFFQVTETLDFKKYFLDIEKIQRFPITFVVKTEISVDALGAQIKESARRIYPVDAVVQKYLAAIEELINIPVLLSYLDQIIDRGKFDAFISEVILQATVEFNLDEDEELMSSEL